MNTVSGMSSMKSVGNEYVVATVIAMVPWMRRGVSGSVTSVRADSFAKASSCVLTYVVAVWKPVDSNTRSMMALTVVATAQSSGASLVDFLVAAFSGGSVLTDMTV